MLRSDNSLTAREMALYTDHDNHLKREPHCLACHTKDRVRCPGCERMVYPWRLVDVGDIVTTRYGVRVIFIRRNCKQCQPK